LSQNQLVVLYSSMIQLIDKVKAFNNKYSKSLVSVSEEIMVRSHLIAESELTYTH